MTTTATLIVTPGFPPLVPHPSTRHLAEHGLPPPDIMTFAKKLQTAGYFSTKEMRPSEGYRIFNTWMGDPAKVLMLQAMLDE